MSISEQIYGQIAICFPCGCKAQISWIYKNDPATGINSKVKLDNLTPCSSHQNIRPDLFNWKNVLDSVLDEQQEKVNLPIETYYELFYGYDKIQADHELNYYTA